MDIHTMFKRPTLLMSLYKHFTQRNLIIGIVLTSSLWIAPIPTVSAFSFSGQSQENSPSSKTAGEVIDDATITGKIKTKLLTDSVTHALNINVDTDKGVVTLAGTAHTQEEREKAVMLASETNGVKLVKDKLIIASHSSENPQTLSAKTKVEATKIGHDTHDSWITTKIKSKLATTEGLKSEHIHVFTQQGIVRLEGQVNSEQARQEAISQARNTEGVNRVNARGLTVVKIDAR